jgi:Glycosyl transferase family 2
MTIVSITPRLDVLVEDGDSAVSSGDLFAGYDRRKIVWNRRLLALIARTKWVPRSLSRIPLRICSTEIGEALLARDPDALEVGALRWGRELRRELGKRHSWPWIRADASETNIVSRHPSAEVDPLVTIVLPTYNGVRFLEASIRSCLGQTYRNLELVVVDDGSTADIRAVVARFPDSRVRYFRHEQNQGVAAGLNTGFENSRGRYLTWTSDDNFYAPGAIETLVAFLRKYPEVDFVYSQSHLIDEDGVVSGLLPLRPPATLQLNNFIGPCFLYKREVYAGVGEYRRIFLAEDYDYWIRVAQRFRMQRLFRPLYYYRIHPDSLTGRYSDKEVDQRVTEVKRMNRFGSRNNR